MSDEDWREKCKDCSISESCFVKNIVNYCSGIIDVKPLLKMISEAS